jgi:hypothetical protein
MKLRVYHGDKPEAKHRVVEAIDEVIIGIRNEPTHAVATFNGIMIGSMHSLIVGILNVLCLK